MIRDVTLKTCRRWWMIGRRRERGSGISVLAACHDDDDLFLYIYIYTYIHTYKRWFGLFNSISTPYGLFHAEIWFTCKRLIVIIMIFLMFYFFSGTFIYQLSFLYAVSNIPNTNNFLNRSIWPIDGTLTGTTTPGQSGPISNANERMTKHPPELQIWSLIIGWTDKRNSKRFY